MTTKETVVAVLARVLLVEEGRITPDAELREDLNMDSLDQAQIARELEEQLLDGDPIDDETIERWKTVEDIQKDMASLTAQPIHKRAR